MKWMGSLALGFFALTAQAGEIRSDDPCVLAAVRSAFAQAAVDRAVGASSEELEAGLLLDVAAQYSTRFERYKPQLGYYVVKVDASLRTLKTYTYEAYVAESADGKSCEVKSLKTL